jgi:hypothetical protein
MVPGWVYGSWMEALTFAPIYKLMITVYHTVGHCLLHLRVYAIWFLTEGLNFLKGVRGCGHVQAVDRLSVGVSYMGDRYVGLQRTWWGIYAVLTDMCVYDAVWSVISCSRGLWSFVFCLVLGVPFGGEHF